MVYVKRDCNNNIIAVFKDNFEKDLEEISENDSEVNAFMIACGLPADNEFLQSDLELIRVIEDLINIMMEKDIIHITDFPIAVINKLVKRKKIRQQFDDLSDILESDE